MQLVQDNSLLPEELHTKNGDTRRVGIEIELAGLSADRICELLKQELGGKVVAETILEHRVEDTKHGTYIVELDASLLKDLAEKHVPSAGDGNGLINVTSEVLTKAAEQFVPWEIVTPPIRFTDIADLDSLVEKLRNAGALGTRHAAQYAFGVHLNPELPNLSAKTIVSYLKAYVCLYDWISENENIDKTRKLTPYIDHFPGEYIDLLIKPDYWPSIGQLIDDYLEFNATRNRSLDMLPLFAFINERRVRNVIDDPRIKARPTFHYRLPNCDIDNQSWNISLPWGLWLEVEALAMDEIKLEELCLEFQQERERLLYPVSNQWEQTVDRKIS